MGHGLAIEDPRVAGAEEVEPCAPRGEVLAEGVQLRGKDAIGLRLILQAVDVAREQDAWPPVRGIGIGAARRDHGIDGAG